MDQLWLVKVAYSFVAFCPIFGFGTLYTFWPINDKPTSAVHKALSGLFFTALYVACLWLIWQR